MSGIGDGATIVMPWADGEYKFCLRLGEIRELQDKCKAGFMDIMMHLREGHWWIDEPREVIRLGLIGGGMQPAQALVLVTRYVDGRPRLESIIPAFKIIAAAMQGVEQDQPGKETVEEPQMTDGSASPQSMAPEPSSAGHQEKLIN